MAASAASLPPPPPGGYAEAMDQGAIFDRTGRYRYCLWREWDATLPVVAFVLLNPSTADASRDDPTIRRCLGFARTWGFGRLEVVNLFALRATDPSALRQAADPVGPRNDEHLRRTVRAADRVVAAWGNGGRLHGRGDQVMRWLDRPMVLGWTKARQPRHPLYLRREVEVQGWRVR